VTRRSALLRQLIDHDIHILRSDLDRILFILASHVAGAAGGGVAVFVEADGDVDFAGERRNSPPEFPRSAVTRPASLRIG